MTYGSKGSLKRSKIIYQLKKNENTRCQNYWDTAKVVLRMKVIELNVCIMKEEKS